MNTQNLSTLKIHKLTREQYERELAAGNIDANALYLTPDEEVDLSPYATVEQLNDKADKEHGHTIGDVENLQVALDEINSELSDKASSSHTHTIANVTNLQSILDEKVPASRTVNGKELTANISLSASDVGAATISHTHDDRYYTEDEIDTKISDVNSTISSHTGNTTVHITSTERANWNAAKTHADSAHVIGVKGNSESTYRTGSVNITPANIGLGNVENKSSATIRGELTKANVTEALGYTPPTTDTTYSAITNDEIDEICSSTITTYLESIAAEGVGF